MFWLHKGVVFQITLQLLRGTWRHGLPRCQSTLQCVCELYKIVFFYVRRLRFMIHRYSFHFLYFLDDETLFWSASVIEFLGAPFYERVNWKIPRSAVRSPHHITSSALWQGASVFHGTWPFEWWSYNNFVISSVRRVLPKVRIKFLKFSVSGQNTLR